MYRFRTIDKLLGKYQELENQEIYFASSDELNDPMEGLRDVYWTGDEIVWENFIKNYTKSLERVYGLTILLSEDKIITEIDIQVSYELLNFPSNQKKLITDEIIDKVFKIQFINELPIGFSKRQAHIRRSELLSYLQISHPLILNCIAEVYYNNGLTNKLLFHQNIDDIHKNNVLPEIINKLENESKENISEYLFSFINQNFQSNNLHSQYEFSNKGIKPNIFFLISEFPNKFITKLENEIYPPWYSASFLGDNKNSAIWGHYGDNHKGVCLKYKTMREGDDLNLNLQTEYGYSSSPIIGMRPHRFRKIEYHNKHVEIDFFRSLGRLRKFELNRLWYHNSNRILSECGSHLNSLEEEEKWRETYWKNYNNSLKIKLKEWEYENEYRLIIHGDFIDYTNASNRKLRYDFNDLESITFGIKTSNSSKFEIIKIIENKCKENNRKRFDFFQAYYSKKSGQIESFKLNF
ncbi:DUF2971 domain-containing protein [Mariniflexile sp. HMF6888]|uniref:DUF2971 domain-containing protein n=1 Tax=Mariniflexile sp. HMF6888 TaxID=3373086 RepID=UPI0037B9F46B